MIKVVVCGATGKVGREVCLAVEKDPELKLVGAVGKRSAGKDLGKMIGLKRELIVRDDLENLFKEVKPDVLVDFTHPTVVLENIKTTLNQKVNAVVGTTGLAKKDLEELAVLSQEKGVGLIVAPNFALGAVLMMNFSKQATKYFSKVEILELHHNKKADAPSGTAIKTAETIAQALNHYGSGQARSESSNRAESEEIIKGVRGGQVKGIPLHSIRLPGLNAHQEVIFGGPGQTLKIRHDALDRSCYIPGVIMAIKEVPNRLGLTYGLDKLLEL